MYLKEFNKFLLICTSINCKIFYYRLHYFSSSDTKIQTPITITAFHKRLKLLATGFENGLMMLHILPDFTIISEVKYVYQLIIVNTLNYTTFDDFFYDLFLFFCF